MRQPTPIAKLLLLTLLLLLVSAHQTAAQVSSIEDFDAPVAGVPGKTYLDLLKTIFQDLQPGPESRPQFLARRSIPLRHLFGEYESKVYEGEMKIWSMSALWLRDEGQKHLLLLLEIGSEDEAVGFNWGEIHVLALFRIGPQLQLLDAVDIQADRSASLWDERPVIEIGQDKDAVMVTSYHHNSSQGYQSLALVSVERGRLKTVFEFPTLLNSNSCGQSFTQSATLSVLKNPNSGHRPILVRVKMLKEADDAACEKRTSGFTRFYKALLVWNPAKREYSSRGKELDQLASFNERNF